MVALRTARPGSSSRFTHAEIEGHDGLHISFGPDRSDPRCSAGIGGDLQDGLRSRGITPHVIGGAALAAELDAKRAIRQGTELAAKL